MLVWIQTLSVGDHNATSSPRAWEAPRDRDWWLHGIGLLDDIHGCVQDCTNSATNCTGDDVVADLALLRVCHRQ